ncbi:MAG TPA: hypothetical protein VHW43_00060 [Puia sp.]|nr:hypothetical protein [Puia sp.]
MLLFRDSADPKTLIPFPTSFTSENSESNDRIFFRMILGDKEELDILCNKPGYELLQQKEISGLIAFSDGTRRRIITQSQGTADDKNTIPITMTDGNSPPETTLNSRCRSIAIPVLSSGSFASRNGSPAGVPGGSSSRYREIDGRPL